MSKKMEVWSEVAVHEGPSATSASVEFLRASNFVRADRLCCPDADCGAGIEDSGEMVPVIAIHGDVVVFEVGCL